MKIPTKKIELTNADLAWSTVIAFATMLISLVMDNPADPRSYILWGFAVYFGILAVVLSYNYVQVRRGRDHVDADHQRAGTHLPPPKTRQTF